MVWSTAAPHLRQLDRRTVTWSGLLLALGTAIGLTSGAGNRSRPVSREAERESALQSIARLEEEQRQLKEQIARLRAELTAAQQRQVAARTTLSDLETELRVQQELAGLTLLRGPGISVVLNDSAATAPPGSAASDYIVHDTDVRDIVNSLWSAAAAAIAVNGERLVATSSIVCVGTVIIINNTRLSPPYQVVAIGEPGQLVEVIDSAPQLSPLRRRVRDLGLQVKVSAAATVEVPAYRGTLTLRQTRGG